MTDLTTKTIYDFSVKSAKGKSLSLREYQGKVMLIVNVASLCGFTPQYKGLERLFQKFKDRGFIVVGFPCNQFGSQEPDSDSEIQNFCSTSFDVTFPVMAKIEVNGDKADPLFQFLKASARGLLGTEAIKWNFTKFLIGKDGKVIDRFAPATQPELITKEIEKALS